MNTLARPINLGRLVSMTLGIAVALIVLLTLTGRRVPFIPGDKAAFFTVAALGFLMCTFGLGSTTSRADFSWLNPFTIVAVLLGSMSTLLVVLVLIGRPLPIISSDRGAIIALALIIFSKWVLAFVHRFISY